MKLRFNLNGYATFSIALLLTASGAAAQNTEGPSLVVMVVVDQLRGDLIDHYEDAFSGGLRRMLDQGYRFTSAAHAHARTHTAAGHATLATGVFPSRSGIVGNSWSLLSGDTWRSEYAVEDLESPILGFERERSLPGRSPENLLRTGLADWVRAADDGARTVSISSKDRSAIPLAGKTRSDVYWLLPQLARFVTSSYYTDRYPDWIIRFNQQVMPGIASDAVWQNDTPQGVRSLARDDDALYEKANEGRGGATFPHRSADETRDDGFQAHNQWVLRQSRADDAVVALAQAAIDEFDLGRRGSVDYLAVALSATDYVGHDFGPFSQEQLANLVNVDRILGELLDYLDAEVGEGSWVLGLSGDHGVVTMPEYEQARGNADVKRIPTRAATRELIAAYRVEAAEGGSFDELAERLARSLEAAGTVERAYTHLELTQGEPSDSFAVLFRNSHYPGRAHHTLSRYGVEVRYPEGDLVHPRSAGTTHGTPYWYDRHVPFMLLGAGIENGSSDAAAYTVDMAPTLAALVGVSVPTDLDGRAIYRE